MTSRHWADGPVGNTPISAAALNAMEADIAAAGYMGTIATGTDLNTLTAAGIYGVPTGTIYASLVNAPTGIMPSGAGWLDVRATSNGLYKQVFGFYGTTPVEVWRTTASVTAGTWNAWTRKDVGAINNPYVGVATNVRVMDFTERRGGTKYTNGLGAVAVRYDHGLVNMKATVYPLMVARGIPFSLAINSRTWGNAENNGTTAADVQSWVDAGWCEIWNHGADHSDQTTLAGLTDQIVTALSELKAQFPTVPIDGFIVPGVGGTNYNGFNGGGTPEAFYKTDAGRLILENHAVSTGSFPGTIQRVLDGKLRQGQSHYSMEAATVASITAQIDSAVTNKTGLQLFLHPSLLDTPGYMTTAMLTTVLDYIKTKRDAGLLAVMSPSDLLIASSEYAPATTAGKVSKTDMTLNVRDNGAKGDGTTDDSPAILTTITANPAGVEWGRGTYYVPATTNIPGLEAFNHSGTAIILKGTNQFYIGGKRSKSQRNTLYVDPAGVDTNDGLHTSTPFKTLAKAAAVINAWADNGLKGLWRVQLAAGTYTQDRFLLNSMVKSDYPIEVRGPDVGGHPNVPTAIIDNTGGTSDDIFSTGYNSWLNIYDVKVINHTAGSAFHASRSMLNLTNCHVANVYTGVVYEHNSGLGLFGGLWDGGNITLGAGIRGYYGSTHNLVTTDLTTSTLFTNWVVGLQIGEGSFGHLDYVRISNCTVGVQFNRADSGANTKNMQIYLCGTGVQAWNSAWFNNTIDFGLGTANACTVTVDERGDSPEYGFRASNNTSRTVRQMDTYRGATRTGNTNKNAEYTALTIPQGRLSASGLRNGHTTRMSGAMITTVSTGSTITLSFRLGSVTTDEVAVVIPAGGAVARSSFTLEVVSFATNSHRMVLTLVTPSGTTLIGYKEVTADSNATDLALAMYYQLGNVADSFSVISATCSTTVGG